MTYIDVFRVTSRVIIIIIIIIVIRDIWLIFVFHVICISEFSVRKSSVTTWVYCVTNMVLVDIPIINS